MVHRYLNSSTSVSDVSFMIKDERPTLRLFVENMVTDFSLETTKPHRERQSLTSFSVDQMDVNMAGVDKPLSHSVRLSANNSCWDLITSGRSFICLAIPL